MIPLLAAAAIGGLLGAFLSHDLLSRGRKMDVARLDQLARRAEAGLALFTAALTVALLPRLYTVGWVTVLAGATLVLGVVALAVLSRKSPIDRRIAVQVLGTSLFAVTLCSEAVLSNAAAGGLAAEYPEFNHSTYGKRSFPALAQGAGSRTERVRMVALLEMSEDFRREMAPTVLARLQDPSPRVREAALTCISRCIDPISRTGDPVWIDPLSKMAADPDLDVAQRSWELLGAYHSPRAALPLVSAAARFSRTDSHRVKLLNIFLNDLRGQLVVAAPAIFNGSAATTEGAHIRATAAEVLGSTRDGRAQEPLEVALHDRSPEVRANAAAALATLAVQVRGEQASILGGLDARTPLIDTTGESDPNIDFPRVIAELRAALQDGDGTVRAAAIEGLAKAIDPILSWGGHTLDARNPDSRLPWVDVGSLVPGARRMLHDPDTEVQSAAGTILRYANGGDGRSEREKQLERLFRASGLGSTEPGMVHQSLQPH